MEGVWVGDCGLAVVGWKRTWNGEGMGVDFVFWWDGGKWRGDVVWSGLGWDGLRVWCLVFGVWCVVFGRGRRDGAGLWGVWSGDPQA